jgi:hypothetical protein
MVSLMQQRFLRLARAILIAISFMSTQAFAQKISEAIVYSPPPITVSAEPRIIRDCDNQPPVIRLSAESLISSSTTVRYAWRTSGGHIMGTGPNVTWDLAGLRPGYYKAYVDIASGTEGELCEAFSSTTVLVDSCPPPTPVCPAIAISSSTNLVPGEPVEFGAKVSGGSNELHNYIWTISAGTIISGQGTDFIRVDTSGLAGDSIIATVAVGGYPTECSAASVVHLPVPVECRKFDEFPHLTRNDEKARLDNFAVELLNDPRSNAYMIIYPGAEGPTHDVQRHTSRIVDYLINTRRVDGRRIVTLVGPTRSKLIIELWNCPQGAQPPKPSR